MNVRKLKERLTKTIIGTTIVGLWVAYAIITDFNFIDFITNPSVIDRKSVV
jgi:hypothetical protein